MATTPAPLVYRIDGMEVDVARGVLCREGGEIHLKPKAFQILLHLIANRDRLVSKEELMELCWKDAAVTDDALTQCIGELRRAFEDDARSPRYFKTVPKRGYRFVAEVEEIRPATLIVREEVTTIEIQDAYTEEAPLRQLAPPRNKRYAWWVLAAALAVGASAVFFWMQRGPLQPQPTPGKRLAVVLPFENRSGQPDLEWLRDGLPDMLTATLTRSPSVDVLSREQAALWLGRIGKTGLPGALEAARRSHAQLAVTGSFARLGSSIRVDAQIYDGQTGALLAADGITASPDQVLRQVDYLSARLAIRLRAPREADKRDLASLMTDNLEAYRDYEIGLGLVDSNQIRDGIASIEKAIALDPKFAMAYARIGYAHAVEGRQLEEGRPYLEKAFQMGGRLSAKDRQNVMAWYALANADYQSAIHQYSELVAAYPNETEAYFRLATLLRGESRHAEAVAVIRQALAIDPEDPKLYNGLAAYSSELGRHAEAIEAARQSVTLSPSDTNAFDSLGLAYEFAGQYDDALAAFTKAIALKPDFEIALIHLGELYWFMGRERDALRQQLERATLAPSAIDRGRYWDIAAWEYWRRGRKTEAVAAIRKAMQPDPKRSGSTNPARLWVQPEPLEAAMTQGRAARYGLRTQYFFAAQQAQFHNRPAEMLEDLRAAMRCAPSWGSLEILEDALADGYRELGRWDDAIAEYRRALGLFPGMARARFHLAQSLEHQGQAEAAKVEFRKFLEVWKDADAELPEMIEARRAAQ